MFFFRVHSPTGVTVQVAEEGEEGLEDGGGADPEAVQLAVLPVQVLPDGKPRGPCRPRGGGGS